jgi:tetratricopeptide (TPR) repeat protein
MQARSLIARIAVAVMLIASLFAQSPQELAATASAAMKAQRYPEAEKCYRELVRIMPESGELRSNLGLSLYYQSKLDEARAAFQNALRFKPELFVPNFFLGRIYFDVSRYQDAVTVIKTALRAQPDHREARLLLGASLVGLSRVDEASSLYTALARENPRDAEAYYGLGLIYLDLGRKAIDRLAHFRDSGLVSLVKAEFYADRPEWSAMTVARYQEAVSRSPGVPGLRTRLGMYLLKTGRWDEAASAFDQELKRDPYSYEAHFGLSALRLRAGDVAGSLRELNAAAGIRPQFFDPPPPFPIVYQPEELRGIQVDLEQAGQDNFGAAYLLAVLQADRAGNWLHVAEKLRKRLLDDIAPPSAPAGTVAQRRNLGLEYVRRKRYEDGARMLLALPEAARGEPEVRTALARSLFACGRIQELVNAFGRTDTADPEILYLIADSYKQLAQATLQRVVELDPDSARAHRLYGDSLVARGLFNQAAKEYEVAAKIEPRDAEVLRALGDAYHRLAAFDLEAETYRRLVELEPLDPQAYYLAGASELHRQRPGEAIPLLRKALQLKPDLSLAEAQLGRALALEGRTAEAINHLERGAVADTDGGIHYQLARLYRETGDQEKARKALESFRRLREEQKRRIMDLTHPGPDSGSEAVDAKSRRQQSR